jgi:murein DD-endopeptidase MepM/ murein hydrolase activator NlpD
MDETNTPLSEEKTEDDFDSQVNKKSTIFNLESMMDSSVLFKIGVYAISGVLAFLIINSAAKFLSKNVSASTPVDLQATANVLAQPTIDAANSEANLNKLEQQLGAKINELNLTPQANSTIPREAQPFTIIPSRARDKVITYDVVLGDNVFSIAENFGLTPETILWGNFQALDDNVRYISVGQELNILPTNGTYHYYLAGESLTDIANQYEVSPEAITEYSGNNLDPYNTDLDNPEITNGTWIIVPGGQRELKDWGPPPISRDNPAIAAYYGGGSCGAIYEGAVGNGYYIWPTAASQITQGYSGVHAAIDIGGTEGVGVFASDSGVVVYTGWSDYGYGLLVVVDHGFGNQTAYAHLLSSYVSCGQSVFQGDTIAQLGNSGNSTGPHLHFEINTSTYGKVNPMLFVTK